MSSTFGSEVLVGLIVAAMTAFFGWVAFQFERKRNERAALKRLIGNLARRRAFNFPKNAVRSLNVENELNRQDYENVGKSIVDVRDAVDEARSAAREKPPVHRSLDQMTVDCNFYLEYSQNENSNYVIYLDELRAALSMRIAALQAIHSSLPSLQPGSKAFESE